jgi:hypothetical protein
MAWFTAYVDATFSATKMQIIPLQVHASESPKEIAQGLNYDMTLPLWQVGLPSQSFPVGPPAEFLTADRVTAMYSRIRPAGNQLGWMFYAPAAGTYTMVVWVPGAQSQPRTTIELYSASSSTTSHISHSNVPQTQSAPMSFIVDLPKGVCGLRVTANSGNVIGVLDTGSVFLNNSTPVSWVLPKIPLPVDHSSMCSPVDLVSAMPGWPVVSIEKPNALSEPNTWGSPFLQYTHTMTYPRYPVGMFQLWSPNIGTVTFPPDPYSAFNADPLPPAMVYGPPVHIYGEPTDEQLAQLLPVVTYHLDFEEYNDSPVLDAGAMTIKYYLRRISDFESWYIRIPIHHPVSY